MSRIGKSIIQIPAGVTVSVKDNVVTVKGPKGELTQTLTEGITLEQKDGVITMGRPSESKSHKALHGLYRALVNNMIAGTAEGFTKKLELVGVGYRAASTGNRLDLSLGFSHGIVLNLPLEVSVETLTEKGKNPIITLNSYDKQLLGMVAAKIRSFRKPEPYKGKGVRFVGEIVRRKAGKSA
ncbi:MAG: 50S ribosomal protein L6 [Chryseobacterium sp.]|nr:50S ribosomal protein L6 [Chryseobacterium sp.]